MDTFTEISTLLYIAFSVLLTVSVVANIILYKRLSAKKHYIRRLKISDKNLRNILKSKYKLISMISHDLKNPIATYISLNKHLFDSYHTISDGERKDYISMMYSSAKQTYELLTALLDWSRARNGMLKSKKCTTNLKELIETSIIEVKDQADAKSINLVNNTDLNINSYVDPIMIKSVIRNLLTNAIKYSPPGKRVIIETSKKGDKAEISVIDSGIGIEKNKIPALFDYDFSYSTPGTNNEKGTGFGLIISKDYIEQNNGTIDVESKIGQGSKFTISLPIGKSNEKNHLENYSSIQNHKN